MRFTLLLFLLPLVAHAHQSSLSSSNNKVLWPALSVPVTISTNTSDLDSTVSRNIILGSVAQWNAASSMQIYSASTSQNTLSFSADFSEYGDGVVGITEVTYNAAGTIQKANILLNDNYQFMDTPGLYSSNQIYLGDVVTHEMGHMLGMSHSEVLDASMFYSSFSGQSTVSYDDRAGVRSKYDSNYGTIKGYVKGGSDIGILGVHVQAISRKTGQLVGVFSDVNGRFVIGGLDVNDTFYLYTSPIKNAGSLPAYFTNSQSDFCPGSYVGGFFQECGNEGKSFPQPLNLTASEPTLDVGVVTINCSLKTNEDYNFEKLETVFMPQTIYDFGLDQRSEKSFVGHFRSTSVSTWSAQDKLAIDLSDYSNVGGNPKSLKLSLLGRKFGNQLEYEMEVWRNGVLVPGSLRQKSYSGTLETYETDLEVIVPLLGSTASNIFEIRIRARKLSTFFTAQTFPDFELFSTSSSLPYLLISSIVESPSGGVYLPLLDSGVVLSDNQSCLDAPLSYKVASSQEPKSNEVGSQQSAAAAASCGTIEPPNNGGSGPQSFIMAFGFMLSLLAHTLVKRSKKFLS